jgi:NADPH:quinone reductase-like Zn-dependent oxidoreductase
VEGFRVGQPVAALLNDFGRGSRTGGYTEVVVARTGMVTAVPEGADLARAAAVLATVSPRGSHCTTWLDSRPATTSWY